jgi:hypothetical protein
MPDDNSEKIVRLLEEIRDLTRIRNDKLESMSQDNRKRAEERAQRFEEVQRRAIAARQRFLWILGPLLLLAIGFMMYLGFWVIPASDAKQTEQQMLQYRLMQSNYLAQPH